MAADLGELVPEFRKRIDRLLARCARGGVTMRPFFTLRSPIEQARLWRQSRSREEIATQIAQLKADGAPFLAHCLESAGPQNGPPVTNALPGFSWHQWGEAVDCFWLIDGKAEGSTRKQIEGRNGYQVLAGEAAKLGLTAGGLWSNLKDWPHVQYRVDTSPLRAHGLEGIDHEMARRFHDTP